MNGLFQGCKQQASAAAIDAYLAKAKTVAAGYYQQLLVKTLTSDYARFKAGMK